MVWIILPSEVSPGFTAFSRLCIDETLQIIHDCQSVPNRLNFIFNIFLWFLGDVLHLALNLGPNIFNNNNVWAVTINCEGIFRLSTSRQNSNGYFQCFRAKSNISLNSKFTITLFVIISLFYLDTWSGSMMFECWIHFTNNIFIIVFFVTHSIILCILLTIYILSSFNYSDKIARALGRNITMRTAAEITIDFDAGRLSTVSISSLHYSIDHIDCVV